MTSGVRINWGPHVGDVSGRVLAVAASPRECGAVGGRGGWARPRGARTFFFWSIRGERGGAATCYCSWPLGSSSMRTQEGRPE